MSHVIEVQELGKTYRTVKISVPALRGVSFSIDRGEFVSIMGPSGSGKSTLMNLLGCLDRPSRGHYILDGVPVERLNKDQLAAVRNSRIGFVFQSFNLLTRKNALENVEMPLIYNGFLDRKERQARSYAALKAVGLGDRWRHRPYEMSGGEQQRVAIARALVNSPTIVMADEPTGNLDSHSTREVMEVLKALNEDGITVLLVTHEPEVSKWTDRLLTIKDGMLAADTRINEDSHAADD
jgi:putative ABC transport system ATP-binding protein